MCQLPDVPEICSALVLVLVGFDLKVYTWGNSSSYINVIRVNLVLFVVCQQLFTCLGVTQVILNPFLANVPILYLLKTPENQRFPGVFRRYKMGTLARNGSSQVTTHTIVL